MVGTWDSDTGIWDEGANESLSPIVIFGDTAGVSTRRSSAADDNGTPIEANLDTKDYTAADLNVPDIDRMVRWTGIEMWAKGVGVSVYYSTDGGTNWTLISTHTLLPDYPADSAPINVWFDVVSSRIRFRFYDTALASGFTLKKYQIEATLREARK